jgi:hypothetical protein
LDFLPTLKVASWSIVGFSSTVNAIAIRVYVRYYSWSVVDKETLGRVFLRVLQVSRVIIIPPVLYAHSFIYHRRYTILLIDIVVK